VDTVSRPLLIALVAVVGFAGVWFALLRPEPAEKGGGAAPTPAHSVGTPVQPAAAGTPATRGPVNQAAPVTSTQPEARASAADRSAPILRDLEQGKVSVLLFWNPQAADDRAVRDAVAAANRRGGRVTVHFARISHVANYDAITQGVEVLQTPTVLVIGPDHKARSIVGLTDVKEIEQVVGDVGGGKNATTATGYRAAVGESCGRLASRLSAQLRSTGNLAAALATAGGDLRSARTEAAQLTVPARYGPFHREWLTYLTGVQAAVGKLRASAAAGHERATALQEYFKTVLPLDRAMTQSARDAGVTCAA
jgi:hypothetical protein